MTDGRFGIKVPSMDPFARGNFAKSSSGIKHGRLSVVSLPEIPARLLFLEKGGSLTSGSSMSAWAMGARA